MYQNRSDIALVSENTNQGGTLTFPARQMICTLS